MSEIFDDTGILVGTSRDYGPGLYGGLAARLLARIKATSLDDALVAGADPTLSGTLRSRIAYLTSRRNRDGMADGLQRLLARAAAAEPRTRTLGNRKAALANSSLLQELAALLRTELPLYAGGLARLHRILTDSLSPMYRGNAAALARALNDAAARMRGA